jgi:large subunit ribosomal protein L24
MSRTKTHVKKGDTVVVIAGAHKGAQGTIKEVQPAKSRVLIEGVRII